jgi:hypothetical protein
LLEAEEETNLIKYFLQKIPFDRGMLEKCEVMEFAI